MLYAAKGSNMIDLTGVQHHHALEEIVDVICSKTQNSDKGFFRAEVAYFMGMMASSMRTIIRTKDRGDLPVNLYAICLSPSGTGKGHSVNIMENEFLDGFRKRFSTDTLAIIADANLHELSTDRAIRNGTDVDTEREKLDKEYRDAGTFRFSIDSGTVAAVKQFRHKLLLANAGSINLSIDEIGSNIRESTELLNLLLELYDQGLVKDKLTKNTHENIRVEEIEGKTPANALLFGTPSSLLDGGPIEDVFYNFLETGYARRSIFGWGTNREKMYNVLTPEQAYQDLISPQNNAIISKWNTYFATLADPAKYGWVLEVIDDVAIKLLEYKFACEKMADELPDHEDIRKAEMSHRYFKSLKLAGAYAFVDHSVGITMDHLLSAILLVEQSGEAFEHILNREKTYVKLAKYIATVKEEVTHADLLEALPFYKSGIGARNELMSLAIAWGYKQHVLIKKSFAEGIEFFSGETLDETDLDKVRISYSDHFAYNYVNEEVPFDELHNLISTDNYHFLNHYLRNGHRTEENVQVGFNLLVLDIDGGASIELVQDLLKEYKFLLYTTKSHTPEDNRFRVILPINYYLELNTEDYRDFVNGILAWLPFTCDEVTNQRSRKWRTNDQCEFFYNDGQLIDALTFIPRTTKNEQFKSEISKIESMDNLERWFAQRIASGNRNNQMIKYAFALADSGMDFTEVSNQVKRFNGMLQNSLSEVEIENTILKSVAKRYTV